jgi:hypothetical protein
MGYLPSAKRNRELNTLAIGYKAPNVFYLKIDVVFARQRAHLDFLDGAGRRGTLRVVRFLLLRVPVFVEVGDTADGRLGGRRYLD